MIHPSKHIREQRLTTLRCSLTSGGLRRLKGSYLAGVRTTATLRNKYQWLSTFCCEQEVPMRGHIRSPEVPHECPQQLVDIIDRCTARDPDQRPSASEVFFLLQACPPKLHDQKDLLATPSESGQSVRSKSLPDVCWSISPFSPCDCKSRFAQ